MHSDHPDSHTHGLADDCERCAEHAKHPLRSLDNTNLRNIMERIVSGLRGRSENETEAMICVRRALEDGASLVATDPTLFCEFVLRHRGIELMLPPKEMRIG
jgi:hypothetical protein